MKKFKDLIEADAKDYKKEKDSENEVKNIEPRSDDEKKFRDVHKTDRKKHPTADDEVFDGNRKGGKVGKSGQDNTGYNEPGEPVLKTYAQFAKMGGHGGDSYKGVGKSAGEKAPVMQGSSKIKEEVELDEAKNYEIKNGKIHISKANFRKVHKDYKNSTKGKERMMALDPKSGATTSYEVVFEEADLDEAFKAGKIQFKDGKYKVIDAKTAEILNNAMNELNTTNRKRMETEAMKDTESFEAMLKFAKAAV